MNARFPLLAAVALSILSFAPASAVTFELFHETFDKNEQNWSYTSTGARKYDKTWTETDVVKPGYKGVKLGSTTATGAITSEPFSLSNTTDAVSISIVAAAYPNNGGGKEGITVTVFDSSDAIVFSESVQELTQHTSEAKDEIPSSSAYTKLFTVPVASLPSSGDIYLKIESTYTKSGQRRALIGDVLVTQSVSSGLPALDAPGPLSSSDIGFSGFTLSWTDISGATGYEVTVTNATGATVFTGSYLPSERTATVTGLSEGTTYTASVVAKGDGTTWDDSDAATIDMTTATAPAVSAPALTASAVSPASVTVSWSAQNSASFSVRAWTLVPADSATEDFANYAADGTVPEGWTFNNSGTPYGDQSDNPVDFRADGEWIGSPVFGGTVTNISFRLRRQSESGSTFTVYGSTGSADESVWKTAENTLATLNPLATQVYDIPVDASKGITRVFFQYTKSSGNVSIGTFSVKGAGVGKQPSYLTGYGPTAAAAGATSVTISNPVAGETNYVEVTATGLTGRTAVSTLAVPVPARPGVISVK